MYKYLILIVTIAITTGCVSTKNTPLTSETIGQLKGKEISLTSREKSDFAAMTAGKAMFGALGGAAMVSAGNKIIQTNDVEDPSGYMGQQLADELAKKYNATISHDEKIQAAGDDISKMTSNLKSAYLLDIQTVNWGFVYFPTNWDHYRVMYSAKLRLIDASSKMMASEGFCSSVPEETDNAPTYDQLLLNQAERLKAEIKKAADYCIGEFKTKVLDI